MGNILILGRNGYIASNLYNWLKKSEFNHSVTSISVKNEKWKKDTWKQFDVVINTVGLAHVKENDDNRNLFYKINSDLVRNLALKAKSENVKQFIHFSSMSVFGMNTGKITNKVKPNPTSTYGKSKLKADKFLWGMNSDNFKVAIIRPPMVYGKNSIGNYSKLSKFSKKTPLFPKYPNKRSMIYIDNLCEFVRIMIDKELFGFFYPQNRLYVSTYDMVEKINYYSGYKLHKLPKIFLPDFLVNKIPILQKIFGTLVYDKSISNLELPYNIVDFNSSIKYIEGEN